MILIGNGLSVTNFIKRFKSIFSRKINSSTRDLVKSKRYCLTLQIASSGEKK